MTNKRAIITGCSTGIGRATAIELSARGYDVIATARRRETLDDLKVAETLALDVNDDASVVPALAAVGSVDVLVNSVGFGLEGAIETVPLDEVRRMFDTNFFGAARMIQAFVPGMRERGLRRRRELSSVAGIAARPARWLLLGVEVRARGALRGRPSRSGHFGVRVSRHRARLHRDPLRRQLRRPPRRAPPLPGWPGSGKARRASWAVARRCRVRSWSRGHRRCARVGPRASCGGRSGSDADMIAAAREGMSYDEFEAAMRAVLQLDW